MTRFPSLLGRDLIGDCLHEGSALVEFVDALDELRHVVGGDANIGIGHHLRVAELHEAVDVGVEVASLILCSHEFPREELGLGGRHVVDCIVHISDIN